MHQWPPLSFQFLYCPVLAFPDPPPPSHTEAATNNTFLSHEIMKTLYMEYVQDPALLQHPLVSPLRADSLEGLPPAIILTAELDVLRDESRDYSSRLSLAGVAVEHVLSPGALHAAQLAMGANPGAETRLHFDHGGAGHPQGKPSFPGDWGDSPLRPVGSLAQRRAGPPLRPIRTRHQQEPSLTVAGTCREVGRGGVMEYGVA
eukprot:jgi/Botrbrau1/18883/Bobra.177_2s0042.1